MNCAPAELMAIVLARALRDGDVLVTGTNAAIPMTAYRVAQRCGAPRVVALIGAHGTVDPSVPVAPRSGADEDFLAGRFTTSLASAVGDQLRHLVDVIFLGALQVDRRGRCNLAVVGEYDRPRLRGPGTVGLSMVAAVERALLFTTRHDERTFVQTVDFVSAEGLRPEGRGIQLIVTPLAVLGPTPDRRAIDLVSVHPGVPIEAVQARTGFPLDTRNARETEPPSPDELAALRRVDPAGLLSDVV